MIKKCICYILILIITITLSGCSNNNEEELLKNKISSEIEYLDRLLLTMLNNANGLSLQNYQVSAQKIEEKDSEGSGSGNSQSGASSSSGSSDQASGNQESSGGDSASSSQAETTSGESDVKPNNFQYELTNNNVLMQERTPDWEALASDVESIYADWSIITLDLYKQNIDNQSILGFNTDLDELAKAIKNNDKNQTLKYIAKLYSYIPIYFQGFSDDQMKINLYKVKSNVFNAYSIIETGNAEEVSKHLQTAEESMIAMMNNMGNGNQNENNINKAYIILKDLQNTTSKDDIDIFYLKYKNLVEELNIL